MFVAYLFVIFLKHVFDVRLNFIFGVILQLIRIKVFVKLLFCLYINIKFTYLFIYGITNHRLFLLEYFKCFTIRLH